jgi:hypothetical protein
MRRIFVLPVLVLLCLAAFAMPAAFAADGSPTAPNPDTTSLNPKASSTPNASCPNRPPAAEGAPSDMVVELDPNTLWRPRGSEVRFRIRGPGSAVAVTKVKVCFGWSSPDAQIEDINALIGSPQVRPVINDVGATEYGAVVPNLKRLPDSVWWPRRLLDSRHFVFTGVATVPVADMVVEVTPAEGPVIVTSIQVGVTAAVVAWVVVAVVAVMLWAVLHGIAKYRRIRGRYLLLRVISTQDGYASLSQLQIVLWTLVVGMSAIYVMTLSGNLISISEGTLILLRIASSAALLARASAAVQPAGPASGTQVASVTPAPDPPGDPATPEWADLIIPNRQTQEIDVTRLQMLAFTLITAAFVVIKVVVDYEIPAIPPNFLILMGISNGVYVAGRRLPSRPRDSTTTG